MDEGTDRTYRFKLGDTATLEGGEEGQIIGRAEYLHDPEPSYRLRYVDARGSLVECWWNESAFQQ